MDSIGCMLSRIKGLPRTEGRANQLCAAYYSLFVAQKLKRLAISPLLSSPQVLFQVASGWRKLLLFPMTLSAAVARQPVLLDQSGMAGHVPNRQTVLAVSTGHQVSLRSYTPDTCLFKNGGDLDAGDTSLGGVRSEIVSSAL